jgi:hypothetical protein
VLLYGATGTNLKLMQESPELANVCYLGMARCRENALVYTIH